MITDSKCCAVSFPWSKCCSCRCVCVFARHGILTLCQRIQAWHSANAFKPDTLPTHSSLKKKHMHPGATLAVFDNKINKKTFDTPRSTTVSTDLLCPSNCVSDGITIAGMSNKSISYTHGQPTVSFCWLARQQPSKAAPERNKTRSQKGLVSYRDPQRTSKWSMRIKTFAIIHNNGFEPTENYFDFVQLKCCRDTFLKLGAGALLLNADPFRYNLSTKTPKKMVYILWNWNWIWTSFHLPFCALASRHKLNENENIDTCSDCVVNAAEVSFKSKGVDFLNHISTLMAPYFGTIQYNSLDLHTNCF